MEVSSVFSQTYMFPIVKRPQIIVIMSNWQDIIASLVDGTGSCAALPYRV